MGNSMSQRVNSSTSAGLGFSFSNSVLIRYLTGFSKQKSIFIPKNSPPAGLTCIFHEITPSNSNSDFIVFPPPLIAMHLLYSAPGELWNWDHPKPRDFPANFTISARDGILISTSADEIIHSEEYTCVVSIKNGYPIMTHLYGDTVIDCHPIPEAASRAGEPSGDHHRSKEFLKKCYICRKYYEQMSDVCMHEDNAISSKECDKHETEARRNKVKENNN